MSQRAHPIECRDFKKLLKSIGFSPKPQGATSHEHWVGVYAGERRLVTVDCPKAPFTGALLMLMLSQLGMPKKEFYRRIQAL